MFIVMYQLPRTRTFLDHLHPHTHKQQFNLYYPIQVVRLYVLCSKLERHFQDTLALELKTWNTPTEVKLQSRMWRSPDYSRKRRLTGTGGNSNGSNGGRGGSNHIGKRRRTGTRESSNGSNGGREGSNNGPVEADGFDGDPYMNVMKWRDEVVKDEKEGSVVSDEDDIVNAARLQFEGGAIAPLS